MAKTAIEIVAAVAAATLLVAALESATPATTLGVVYLLAVLAIAITRGELAALVTAVLSVLTLNYFFITPDTASRSPTVRIWPSWSCS